MYLRNITKLTRSTREDSFMPKKERVENKISVDNRKVIIYYLVLSTIT